MIISQKYIRYDSSSRIETNLIITFRDIILYETIIYYRGVDNIRAECISPLTNSDFYFANEL